MHATGVTSDEAGEAASLFESIGENQDAALIRLAAARLEIESGNLERATNAAISSYNTVPGEKAIETILILTAKTPESERNKWVNELQSKFPDSELSRTYRCYNSIISFNERLDPSCTQVDWLHQKAASSKAEFEKISRQIVDLPVEKAKNINAYEKSVSHRNGLLNQYYTDLRNIDNKKEQAAVNGFGRFLWNLLPLPKPGDTWEIFLTREGLCALPIIRWFCALLSAGEASTEVKAEWDRLEGSRGRLNELVRLTGQLRDSDAEKLAYWQSSGPLNDLTKTKTSILPSFKADIDETVHSKRWQAGIPIEEAVSFVAY
jgi:hypothetical protein